MYEAATNRLIRHSLGLLLLAVAPMVLALPEDREQPITLEANTAQYDHNSGISTYSGKVIVTQGSMFLTADKATVYLKDGDIQRMEAEGGPTKIRYQPSHAKPPIEGTGKKIIYNVNKAMVTVTGGAQFTQGCDKFSGAHIEYDLNNDLVTAKSDEQGRVKFIIRNGTTNC